MTVLERTAPPGSRRQAFLDWATKAVDILIGTTVFAGGVFAFIAAPPTILREVQIPALVPLWAGLLLLGGLSAVGRVTGVWIIEVTGLAAGFFGAAGYFVVVVAVIQDEFGVAVASALIFVSMLCQLRRWLELQKFTHEEDIQGFIPMVRDLVRRRTSHTTK